MLNNERLNEIEARANAATKGPWKPHLVDGTLVVGNGGGFVAATSNSTKGGSYYWDWEQMEANATFIARARQDVPNLIAEVRRLREWLEEMCLQAIADFGQDQTLTDVIVTAPHLREEDSL